MRQGIWQQGALLNAIGFSKKDNIIFYIFFKKRNNKNIALIYSRWIILMSLSRLENAWL